jgi:hypothetical protein
MEIVIFEDERFAIRKGNWFTGYQFLVKNNFSSREKPWLWVGIRHPWIYQAYWPTHDSVFRALEDYKETITPPPKKKTDFGRPYKYRV